MADSSTDAAADIIVDLNVTLNETAGNVTAKIPSTPEGMAIAYGSLVLMALLPIFFGAFRSVKYQKEQKVNKIVSVKKSEKQTCVSLCGHPPVHETYGHFYSSPYFI